VYPGAKHLETGGRELTALAAGDGNGPSRPREAFASFAPRNASTGAPGSRGGQDRRQRISGRHLSVHHDLEFLLGRADDIRRQDLCALRIKTGDVGNQIERSEIVMLDLEHARSARAPAG
jgi:hypothetical protein